MIVSPSIFSFLQGCRATQDTAALAKLSKMNEETEPGTVLYSNEAKDGQGDNFSWRARNRARRAPSDGPCYWNNDGWNFERVVGRACQCVHFQFHMQERRTALVASSHLPLQGHTLRSSGNPIFYPETEWPGPSQISGLPLPLPGRALTAPPDSCFISVPKTPLVPPGPLSFRPLVIADSAFLVSMLVNVSSRTMAQAPGHQDEK
jgi:hypothetical protein